MKFISTNKILRPGDTIDFVITASDPFGEELEFANTKGLFPSEWVDNNTFSVEILPGDIGELFSISIFIRSKRRFHARGAHDDKVEFSYTVLPPK